MAVNKMPVKNIIIPLLLITSLLGWGMLAYQNSLQDKSEQRLKSDIMKQVEHLWESYSSIRQEVESSEKIKNFISQQEEIRNIRDLLTKQLEDYHNDSLMNGARIEGLFKSELEGVAKRYSVHEDALSEFARGLDNINKKIDSLSGRLTAWESGAEKREKEFNQLLNNLRADLNLELDEIRQKQQDADNRLAEINDKLKVETVDETAVTVAPAADK